MAPKLSKKQQENLMMAGKILAILLIILVLFNLYRGKQGADLFSMKAKPKSKRRPQSRRRSQSRR